MKCAAVDSSAHASGTLRITSDLFSATFPGLFLHMELLYLMKTICQGGFVENLSIVRFSTICSGRTQFA